MEKKTYFQTVKFFKNISFVNKIVVRQKIKVFYENLISLIKNVKELNSLKFFGMINESFFLELWCLYFTLTFVVVLWR